MKIALKTSVISASLALVFSMPSGDAKAGAGVCLQQYRDCIAAGYEEIECENGYWICRYGYIPAKSAAIQLADHRQD